jgi:L-ascorbate metabolism protein UlaG (beta-lactamase superfamily)
MLPSVSGASLHTELALSPGEGDVEVRWLGTAGFTIRHGETVIAIDPYLTRTSLSRLATRRLTPDEAILERYMGRGGPLERLDAIVIGHTHFDHVLDTPWLARRTGATVYGSSSAAALCRLSGLPERQIVDVEANMRGEPVVAEVGAMRLRFVPSAHSPLLLGRVPFPGDISDCDQVPLRTHQYKCGAVFGAEITIGGRVIYHVGSAELVEGPDHPREVDVALVCVAGWKTSRAFPERMVRALSPRTAVLSHWDDFTRPLASPVAPLPAMDMPRFVDRLHAASRDLRVGTLPLLGALCV